VTRLGWAGDIKREDRVRYRVRDRVRDRVRSEPREDRTL